MTSMRRSFSYAVLAGLAFIVLTLLGLQTGSFSRHEDDARIHSQRASIPLNRAIADVLNNARQENGTYFVQRLNVQKHLPQALQTQQKKRRKDVFSECNRPAEPLTVNDGPNPRLGSDRLSSGQLESDTFDSRDFRALFVNDELRFIYCEVPKVACTNWKRILLAVTGKMNVTRPENLVSADVHFGLERKYLTRLDSYSPAEIRHRLRTYYKFLFVRDPLERILSAYQNKFTLAYNTYFHTRIGRKIIRQHRVNASRESLSKGNDVTFHEFLRYLLATKSPAELRQVNAHWRPFHQLCLPCTVQYDFIGKYETLREDAATVLKVLGVDSALQFPASPKSSKTSKFLTQKYSNVSPADVHRLWTLYRKDFSLFGYSYPIFESSSNNTQRAA